MTLTGERSRPELQPWTGNPGMVRDIIAHQKKELGVNAIICPRWTRSTEDLFSETLLNICFELLREEPETFGGLTVYELFSAGGKDSHYLNPVNSECHEEKITAVAFLALDILFPLKFPKKPEKILA